MKHTKTTLSIAIAFGLLATAQTALAADIVNELGNPTDSVVFKQGGNTFMQASPGGFRLNAIASPAQTHLMLGPQANDGIITDADTANNLPYGGGYFFRVHDETVPYKYRDVLMLRENGNAYFNGNVGFGISNPTERLEVAGNIKAAGSITAQDGKVITHLPWTNLASLPAGYIKLVTPIVANESNMFSIKIRGLAYSNNSKPFEITCSAYAYAGAGYEQNLHSKSCTTLGTELPVELTTEERDGKWVAVIRLGKPDSTWYYEQVTADYMGWQPKKAADFQWVTGETLPAYSNVNMNRITTNFDTGVVNATAFVGDGSKLTGIASTFKGTFTVGGDKDTYYPVTFPTADHNQINHMRIFRGYYEAGPDELSPSHKGGLALEIDWNGSSWGGQQPGKRIEDIRQQYHETFAGAEHTVYGMWLTVWLRGGGFVYHYESEQNGGAPKVALDTTVKIYDHSDDQYDVMAPAPKTAPDYVNINKHKGFLANGNPDAACDASTEGLTRYEATTKKHQGCNGTAWTDLN